MGTRFEILFARARAGYARMAAQAAFAELERLEQELSKFIPTSDIARLNAAKPGSPVRLGADSRACLGIAEEARRKTGGAFDVSYCLSGKSRSPVSRRGNAARRGKSAVDLGGIGKGYALDRMAELLREWETGPALLNAGESTVLATAPPSRGSAWRMKLRNPAKPAASLGEVRIARGAVAGSGSRLHGCHIIDPATGRPLRRNRASWAAAPSAAMADALSTAFYVMSSEGAARICARNRRIGGVIAERDGVTRTGSVPGIRFVLRRGARLG